MKKFIITVAIAVAQITAIAQTINVHFKNGQTIEYPSEIVDYVDFSEKASEPSFTPGEAIDLGLSVLWSSCNLGASTPEEYGFKYAWGETETKNSFTVENYTFFDNSMKTYIFLKEDISGTEFDAATVNLGNGWRMPSYFDFAELERECTWEWIKVNNVLGFKITGKNGNSIFMPWGYYWSSTQNKNSIRLANVFYLESGNHHSSYFDRCNGFYIRPIK